VPVEPEPPGAVLSLGEPLGAVLVPGVDEAVLVLGAGVEADVDCAGAFVGVAAGVVVPVGAVGGAGVALLPVQAAITSNAVAPYARERAHRPWDFTICSSSNNWAQEAPGPKCCLIIHTPTFETGSCHETLIVGESQIERPGTRWLRDLSVGADPKRRAASRRGG